LSGIPAAHHSSEYLTVSDQIPSTNISSVSDQVCDDDTGAPYITAGSDQVPPPYITAASAQKPSPYITAEVFMVLLVEASGLALPSAPHALHRVIAAFRQGHESYLVTR